MNRLREGRATTCIYVQIKRGTETYFVLCDEYDLVESVKSRVIGVLNQIGFELERAEEPLSTEDVRLYLKRRVSKRAAVSDRTDAVSFAGVGRASQLPRPASVQQLGTVSVLQETRHQGRLRDAGRGGARHRLPVRLPWQRAETE